MGGLGAFWAGLGSGGQTMALDLLFTVALPFAVAVAARLYRVWMARLPAAQHDLATQIVGQVVAAVEQLYNSAPPGAGAAKKAEAEKLAAALLAHFGIPVDPSVLNVLIEAAVAALPQALPALVEVAAPAQQPAGTPLPPATAAIRVGTA